MEKRPEVMSWASEMFGEHSYFLLEGLLLVTLDLYMGITVIPPEPESSTYHLIGNNILVFI